MRGRALAACAICLCLSPGAAWGDSGNDVYEDLSQIIGRSVAAPEKQGCVNREPFSEGYACDYDVPGFAFNYKTVSFESVASTSMGRSVMNFMDFPDDVCIDYEKFEAYLLKPAHGMPVRLMRSSPFSESDGGRSGIADEFRFGRAKVSIEHRYVTDTGCILRIVIEKQIR
jgi:hypothetical protein